MTEKVTYSKGNAPSCDMMVSYVKPLTFSLAVKIHGTLRDTDAMETLEAFLTGCNDSAIEKTLITQTDAIIHSILPNIRVKLFTKCASLRW